MKEFWAFIGILIVILMLYEFIIEPVPAFTNRNSPNFPVYTDYNTGKAQDFCGIRGIENYAENKDACCAYKLSCGNDKRGRWDYSQSRCTCSEQ